MGRIGIPELIFIGIVIILLFGVKKLPEFGKAMGQAIREFKKAGKGTKDAIENSTEDNDGSPKS